MAAATGTVVIASGGASFDSATYPRFVLGDGTNTLTFVIDNDARGLKLSGGGDAAGYSSASDLPFEDSQQGRLVVPTYDEADGAKKALLAWIPTDYGNLTSTWNSITANDGTSGLIAIGSRPHYVIRDVDGEEIKIGFGNSNASALTAEGSVLLAKYGSSGSPRYFLYRETSSSRNYFIRTVNTGSNRWKLNVAFMAAIKHANDNGLIKVEAKGLGLTGSLESLSSVAQNTYTSNEIYGVLLQAEDAGYKGNASSMEFKDPGGDIGGSALKYVSWGYDEYTQGSDIDDITRHTLSPTNAQFWHGAEDTKIYFRQGTIAGSGSDASLSTAQIAEAIKDMVNGSVLEITASRSGSTVNLTNDNDGNSGNVTITTTNEGSLFSVSGMSNAGESGGDEVAKTFINNKQIKITSALLPASAGAVDLGSTSAEWSDMYLTDGAAIKFGADQGVTMTHVSGSGVRLNDAWKMQFRSAGVEIYSSAANQLDIDATTVQIAGTTLDVDAAADISGALTLGGALDANSTADFQGAVNLQAGLTVAGALDLNAAADISGATSLAASGVLTDIRGTLSVDEAATFDAGVTFTGAIDANSTSDFQGAMNLQAGITVAGAADYNGAMDVAGATSLAASGVLTDIRGTLSVDEAATFDAGVTFTGAIDANSSADFQGAVNLQDTLTVAGALDLNAAADISGALTLSKGSGDALVISAGDINADGGMDVAGAVALGASGGSADTTVRGDLAVGENLSVSGTLTVNGTTTTVDSTTVAVGDTLLELAKDNTANLKDLGWYAKYNDGSAKSCGMYYDASASEFRLASEMGTETSGVMANPSEYAKVHMGEIDCDGAFDASGAANFQSTIAVAGASTLAAASFSGAIDANSSADFQGAVNLQSTIAVAGASTLAAASFSGAIDANSSADFQGAVNLQDTLTVAGALDLNAAADISGATSLAASGVLTDIRGTLSVDEAATFDAGVTITGAIDANSSADFQGAVNLQDTLTVAGALDLNAAADISGATSLAASGVLTDIRGTLSVDEAATFDAGVTITGAIDANSTSDFQGAMNLQAGITVAGAADYNGAMDVAGATSLAASGVLTDIRGTLSVDEAATFDAAVTISGAISADGAGDAAMDVAADSIYFRDADGTMKREAASDYASSIAGNGLSASSGVLAVDLSELSAAAVDVAADSIMIIDASDSNASKKESVADLVSGICGDGLENSSGVLSISWKSERFTKANVDATSGDKSGSAANKIDIDQAQLSGSEMVFLNGMLLTAEESSSAAGDYDYAITAAGVITFESDVVDLMDSDDVISVQYIKK